MTPANDFAALAEALVTAQDDYSSLWYDAASERYAEMRQVRDDARAALLAYGAAVERERDEAQATVREMHDEMYAMDIPVRDAESIWRDLENAIADHQDEEATHPTEARDA